jgi:flagellar basal body-associated protein FliL
MLSSGPKKVVAEVPMKAVEPEPKDVEVDLVKDRLPNNIGGRLYMYDLQIVAKVSEKDKVKATELFASRDAETRDHIRTIIARSDPASLGEPGLETLRRQIAYQLEQDLGKDGKDLVKEILIPQCTPRPVTTF